MRKLILMLVAASVTGCGNVEVGHVGVEKSWGKVTGKTYGEGFYTYNPLTTGVEQMDTRMLSEDVDTEGASKDMQKVHVKGILNFDVKSDKAPDIYKELGLDYSARVLDPIMQETVKAVLARYTAEQLITNREEVRETILSILKNKFEPYGVVPHEFNITNFDFSRSFNEAIEAKVTAHQNALAAKNKLQQIEFEAQQAVAEARGKAEATQIEAQALRSSPEILQLRAIEKWDGRLPAVTSNSIPMINLDAVKGGSR